MTRRHGLLASLAVIVALSLGCDPRAPGGDPALDEATMALLGQTRALHHQADVLEGAGQYDRAAESVRRVLALPFPRGMAEAEDLRADAYGRLAELSLAANAPDEALAHANTGIADARTETVFRARLFLVKGQALSALAKRASDAGDAATATARRDEALEALDTSIRINQRVLDRLTDAGR